MAHARKQGGINERLQITIHSSYTDKNVSAVSGAKILGGIEVSELPKTSLQKGGGKKNQTSAAIE